MSGYNADGYRAWLHDSETEADGVTYVAGPGQAAIEHARRAYDENASFVSIRVNVRRVGEDDAFVYQVNVLMEPHFEEKLRGLLPTKTARTRANRGGESK